MTAPLFKLDASTSTGEHFFHEASPVSPDTLSADIAPRLLLHYFDEEAARARYSLFVDELSLFDGSALADADAQVEAAIAEERDAVLPSSWTGNKPSHLSVERSEFGEIVGGEVLSTLFGSAIPASRIENSEIPDQPTRGADILALEDLTDPVVTLLLVEVKGSEHQDSPPAVVKGMEAKLSQLVSDKRSLLQELIWLRDHSRESEATVTSRLCCAFAMGRLLFRPVIVPLLVRTDATADIKDPGPFLTSPDKFGVPVRWVRVTIPGSILATAQAAYALARSGGS